MFPMVLNESTFVERVQNQEWFIMFYASWCPHCKHFMPEFKRIGKSMFPEIKFGLVEW